MKLIGILSDTHGFLDPAIFDQFKLCDEVWHAGDFGAGVMESLKSLKLLRGVHGNIDGQDVRTSFPEKLFFNCEGVNVFMQHIGGYPGHYSKGVKEILMQYGVNLFVSGHSHILKIMRDEKINRLLHINPGAAGKAGFHQQRTCVRLKLDAGKIFDVEVIELGPRSSVR